MDPFTVSHQMRRKEKFGIFHNKISPCGGSVQKGVKFSRCGIDFSSKTKCHSYRYHKRFKLLKKLEHGSWVRQRLLILICWCIRFTPPVEPKYFNLAYLTLYDEITSTQYQKPPPLPQRWALCLPSRPPLETCPPALLPSFPPFKNLPPPPPP